MKRNSIPFLLLFAVTSIFFNSCVDLPKDVIAPKWDATFSFPLVDSTLTLEKMLDDSTLVPSEDPTSLGLLYYKSEQPLETFYIDTNLTIDNYSFSTSRTIDSISITNIPIIKQNVLVNQWAPSVTPGDTMIFPESESELEISFPRIDSFSELTLDKGKIKIVIENNLPVEIELRGLQIKNAISNNIVIDYSRTFTISAYATDSLEFDLDGKTIEDSLIYVGTVYSSGSNGNEVIIPENAGSSILCKFDNIVVSSVTAILPKQPPLYFNDIVEINDSAKIERAVFDYGNFDIILDNFLDLAIKIDFSIENLRKADGSIFSETIILNRNEKRKVISYHNLSNWEFVSLNGKPSNKIEYHAEITSIVSNEPSTVSTLDSVCVEINFGKSKLKYFKGIIPITTVKIDETNFDFDIGNDNDKFSYDKIIWKNPGIILSLSSSADLDINFNGTISAQTSVTDARMNFNIELSKGINQEIDLRNFGFVDFINSFSTQIPDSFKFAGSAVINPNYVSGSIANSDSISGKVKFDIPLDVGISGGTFNDTVAVDSLDMSEEDIEAINSITIFVEFRNSIPIELKMNGTVTDEKGNELFPFPPSYNTTHEITIPAPIVNDNGIVTTPGILTQEIELRHDDAQQFLNNSNLEMQIRLNTSKTANNKEIPVKFHNSDSLYYKVYGKINYRVNN